MTNYEKIKAIIESGHIAQTYNKDNGKYALFSSIQSKDCLRISGRANDIDEAYSFLGCASCVVGIINEYNLEISIYQKPVRYPKVGDKVEILESVKQSPLYGRWEDKSKDMIGGPFEVKEVCGGGITIRTKDKQSFCLFDYRHIAPRVHDEEKKEIKGKKVTVTIDGKVYQATID